jgi:hypothetical protein
VAPVIAKTIVVVAVGIEARFTIERLVLHQKIAKALGVPIDLLLPITASDQATDRSRFARWRSVVEERQGVRRRR